MVKVMVGVGELIAGLVLIGIAGLLLWWVSSIARRFIDAWREKRFREQFRQMGGDPGATPEYQQWRTEQRKRGFWK
jgi:hypothetical protein